MTLTLIMRKKIIDMMSGVSDEERDFVEKLVRYGRGDKILPFYFIIFIERTGHTYQQKHQEIADIILKLAKDWTR